jgi:hypothetical protein
MILILAKQIGAYPSGALSPIMELHSKGMPQALLANIRLVWK